VRLSPSADHSLPLGVVGVTDEELVRAGAADNLIRLFKRDKLVKTFKGHTQAVRALAKLDKSAGGGEGEGWFASGSNDG